MNNDQFNLIIINIAGKLLTCKTIIRPLLINIHAHLNQNSGGYDCAFARQIQILKRGSAEKMLLRSNRKVDFKDQQILILLQVTGKTMKYIMFFFIFEMKSKQKRRQYIIILANYIHLYIYVLSIYIQTGVTCQSVIFDGHVDGYLDGVL